MVFKMADRPQEEEDCRTRSRADLHAKIFRGPHRPTAGFFIRRFITTVLVYLKITDERLDVIFVIIILFFGT